MKLYIDERYKLDLENKIDHLKILDGDNEDLLSKPTEDGTLVPYHRPIQITKEVSKYLKRKEYINETETPEVD